MVTAAKQASKKPRKASKYQVVGTTTDGVKILRAKAKAKHFTAKQIRATILKVLHAPAVKN
jgi:hypothetical protein